MNKTNDILERLSHQPQPVIDNPDELTDSIMTHLPDVGATKEKAHGKRWNSLFAHTRNGRDACRVDMAPCPRHAEVERFHASRRRAGLPRRCARDGVCRCAHHARPRLHAPLVHGPHDCRSQRKTHVAGLPTLKIPCPLVSPRRLL